MTCLEQGGCSEFRFFGGVEFSVKAVLLCKVRKKNDCHSEEVRTQPSITTYQHIKPTDISNSYFCQSFVWMCLIHMNLKSLYFQEAEEIILAVK